MKIAIAYLLGLIGFLMQAGAIVGLPVYVFFFDASVWWMLLFFPLGWLGMVPLGMMHTILSNGGE